MLLFIVANFIFHFNRTPALMDTDNIWSYSCSLISYFILIHLINYSTAETCERSARKLKHIHTVEMRCLVTHSHTEPQAQRQSVSVRPVCLHLHTSAYLLHFFPPSALHTPIPPSLSFCGSHSTIVHLCMRVCTVSRVCLHRCKDGVREGKMLLWVSNTEVHTEGKTHVYYFRK